MPRKPSPKNPQPLQLDGALDVQRAIVRQGELAALATRDQAPVILDLSSIASCDTAGVQLLCSARRTAQLSGRDLRLTQPSAAVLRACTEVGIKPEDLGL